MSSTSRRATLSIERMLEGHSQAELVDRVRPEPISVRPLSAEVPQPRSWSDSARMARLEFLSQRLDASSTMRGGASLEALSQPYPSPEQLRGNIENFIGMSSIPTGVIGPLRVNGLDAKGDFYVPMATTEGVLVASYHRGALVASQAGGITSVCLMEGVQRTPSFCFPTFAEAGPFLVWALSQLEAFRAIVSEHTSHGALQEVKANSDGNVVTLIFEYLTGDASGQNMATICTEAICEYIIAHTPVLPRVWYVEGNMSGDKKATAISFSSVRGKKVTAEVVVPRDLVQHALHTTPEAMMDYWKTSIVSGIHSGSIGVNGHYANGLAGIFLATGQDVACVSEASVGTTRVDITASEDLYMCVTLPNLIVGTVGGGTGLETQRACLEIMECYGEGHARKFAEICAATVLAGELSISAAIAAGSFAKAHELFGRKRKKAE